MKYQVGLLIAAFVLFCILLIFLEWGRRIGNKHIANDPQGAKIGVGQIEGTILALLGLLIAFTFHGASQRFDARREHIVSEVNAIGTAWLRVDLFELSTQVKMREYFVEYINQRINVNHKLPDIEASQIALNNAANLQNKIWQLAIDETKKSNSSVLGVVMLPSLNNMFDVATAHNISLITHPPIVIYITLMVLLGCCSFFLGYSLAGTKQTNWLHGIGYVSIMVFTLYIIIDFEFPRVGLIKVSTFDKPMLELRDSMQSAIK